MKESNFSSLTNARPLQSLALRGVFQKREQNENTDLNTQSCLPREKLNRFGSAALSREELLAIILGRGVKGKNVFELAKETVAFLERQPKIPDVEKLLSIRGLGFAKACQIVACLELSGRFLLASDCSVVNTPEDCMRHLGFLKLEKQEVFAVLTLNAGNSILNTHILTRGTVCHAPVHPREAFAKAIEDNAVSVIFVHNHPSGNLVPSLEDIAVTKNLCKVGNIIGIPVRDHLIVSPAGMTSIRRQNSHLFKENFTIE